MEGIDIASQEAHLWIEVIMGDKGTIETMILGAMNIWPTIFIKKYEDLVVNYLKNN